VSVKTIHSIAGRLKDFGQKYGGYLALLAFFALFLTGLRVLDEADGGLLQLRTARSDFEDYYSAAGRMAGGGDLYHIEAVRNMKSGHEADVDLNNPVEVLKYSLTPEGRAYLESLKGAGSYLYLPFFAFALLPLQVLGYEFAVMLFQCLSLALLYGFFYILGRERYRGHIFWYVSVLCMLPVASFLSDNMANGNVGFLLIFLTGAGLLLASGQGELVHSSISPGPRDQQERRLAWMGGAMLGVAAVIKIMPAILGLYFLARRNWRAVGGACLAGVACLLLPAMYGGWNQSVLWHQEWIELMVNTYSQYTVVRPYANNQTVSAALAKLFVAGSDPEKQSAFGLPLFFHSLEDLGQIGSFWLRFVIRSLVYGLLGLAVACAAWFLFSGRLSGHRRAAIYFILGLILVTLLVSGVSWYHAYSLLLIPVALLFFSPEGMQRQDYLSTGLIAFSGFGNLIWPGPLRDFLAIYSLHTWLMFFLCLWSFRLSFALSKKGTVNE
jgi:hypothetical protein